MRRTDRQTRQARIFRTAQSQAPYPLSQHISLAGAFATSDAYDLWYSNMAHQKVGGGGVEGCGTVTGRGEIARGRGGGMVQCLDLTTYASSITGVDEGLYRHKGGFIHRLAYAHTPRPYRQEGRLVYLF